MDRHPTVPTEVPSWILHAHTLLVRMVLQTAFKTRLLLGIRIPAGQPARSTHMLSPCLSRTEALSGGLLLLNPHSASLSVTAFETALADPPHPQVLPLLGLYITLPLSTLLHLHPVPPTATSSPTHTTSLAAPTPPSRPASASGHLFPQQNTVPRPRWYQSLKCNRRLPLTPLLSTSPRAQIRCRHRYYRIRYRRRRNMMACVPFRATTWARRRFCLRSRV
jgi:hypothetical protein